MKIGIIGAGTVAQTIARHVLPFGHQVMLSNTQGPDSLAPLLKKLGPGAIAGTAQQAADLTQKNLDSWFHPAGAAARGFSEHTQWLVDQEGAALLARAEARAGCPGG